MKFPSSRWSNFFVGILFATVGSLFSEEYLADPYVTNPKLDGITIGWATEKEAKADVYYGESPEYGNVAKVSEVDVSDWQLFKKEKLTVQKTRIRGLKPGTKYFYKVEGAGLPTYTNVFYTIPSSAEVPVCFLFGGDRDSVTPKLQDINFIESRVGKPVDFFLDVGDYAIIRRFRKDWQGRIPVILAKGNHDNEKETNFKGLMGQVQHFYDFDGDKVNFTIQWGPLHLVVDGTSPYKPLQAETFKWVEEQFAAAKLPWKLFACHGIFFSDSNHGKLGEGEPRAQQLWPLFKKYGVQLEVNGHDHVYQRTDRVDKDGKPDPQGTVSVCLGGLEQTFWRKSPWSAYQYRGKDEQGFGVVNIKDKTAEIEFWTRTGEKYDKKDSYKVTLP
jgi:hypothetical protein